MATSVSLSTFVLGLGVSTSVQSAPCTVGSDTQAAILRAISAHGDLLLDGGGVAMLPGIILADGFASPAMLAPWLGLPLTLHRMPRADRWGRQVGLMTGPDAGLAETLLSKGAALLDPVRAPAPCVESWRAAEKQARISRRGIWAAPDSPLIDAARPTSAAIGRHVLAQGRVTSVGERPRRAYLNFGPPASGALSVSMPIRLWRDLSPLGITAQSLKGRRVLVRGIPETINGRIILDLTHAASIELDP